VSCPVERQPFVIGDHAPLGGARVGQPVLGFAVRQWRIYFDPWAARRACDDELGGGTAMPPNTTAYSAGSVVQQIRNVRGLLESE